MPNATERIIHIGHSPDPDDAFMFYALVRGLVKIPGCRIEHIMAGIQTLNQRALKKDLEVTAISAHAYPRVADTYGIIRCGSSMGRGYGPAVLSREFAHPRQALDALKGKRIAVPGELTTAALLLKLALDDFTPVQVEFDAVLNMVKRGEVDAGLVIHEGQITYHEHGLFKVLDLGKWWGELTSLPLPLGLNVVRRDLGPLAVEISQALAESIAYAHAHEDEALRYAQQFGRGIDEATNRRFVRMYVNNDSQDLEGDGIYALKFLYDMAVSKGLLKQVPDLTLF
jgi:1,4-dihydroxy-6-naphthoate synthase